MQIVMFDRQSIFIHGMKISLQQRIPGVSIQGAGQADELWQKLESYPEALVMLSMAIRMVSFATGCCKNRGAIS